MSAITQWIRRLIWGAVVHVSRISALMVLMAAVGVALAYGWLDRNILSTLPADLSEFRTYRPPTACRVFAADGREVDQFYLERRVWVPLEELPAIVPQAFISAEDRRFFQHPGVDAFGIARAAVENLLAGTVIQGGSTLTQQLVKHLLVGSERSFERKLKEAILAYRLEKELSKEELLELYLNYVYLGAGNYGVEAAAQDYFGVSARGLNAGQAAMLAGLVPAPSRFSPRAHARLAEERREIVLRAMVRDGYLKPMDVERALQQPLIQPREARPERAIATAYVTQVRREIRRLAGAEMPFQQGLQVYTPLDLRIQQVAHDAVREALRQLADRQGRLAPVRRLDPNEWEQFLLGAAGLDRDARGEPVPPRPGQCFQAMVGASRDFADLRAATFRFRLRDQDRSAKVRDLAGGRSMGPLAERIQPGDVLHVCLEEGDRVALGGRPWGEGAAVVVENATGNVLALVGGYEVGLEGFVRATQARRQPGSSFKPYVYAAKLLKGGSQLDTVLDAPVVLPAGGGKTWAPKNYTGRFAGYLPMRSALAQSINTVAVRLGMEVGPSEIVRVATAMGIRSPLRADL
ncbi:MAG TPA: transglycosylase domain-containing protein, partial [Myxococcaceae bacterium]|nr:transglycosylase domain-containing protein [Myxococcaceae bacterium]